MKKGTKFLITFVIALLVAGLATTLGILVPREQKYKLAIDNVYKKSYYEAMDAVGDTELALTKLSASQSQKTAQALLTEAWHSTDIAATNLSQLSAKDERMEQVIKFLNQLGDYCYYLSQQAQVRTLKDSEIETLDKMQKVISSFKSSMSSTSYSLMNGGSFMGKLDAGVQVLGDSFKNFNNSDIDYPQMIYDGPFSDGLSDREAKFLKDKAEISKEEAEAKIREYFDGVESLNFMTDKSGNISGYVYGVRWQGGEGVVTVTKNGGLISQYVGSGNGGDTVYQEDELVELAPDILEAYGYDGMKVVWVTNNDGNVYLNCAYSADNTIFYPDLVKIKLDANGGGLLGIEAENYLYNHTASRATPSYVYDKATARERVSPKLTIDGEALTLIPTEWNSEIIAYEFHGFIGENEYFVYIDAETLEEVKVLAVIDTGSGRLIS